MTRRAANLTHDPFEAVADPTRRLILEMLRHGQVRTAGAIAKAFPEISRPAVSRHLRVLREASLVIAEEAGREHRYRLNAGTLAHLYHEWFKRFDPIWQTALETLKSQVEADTARQPSRRRNQRT